MMIENKRIVKRTKSFKREYKKAKKQKKDIPLLIKIIKMLANDEPLPEKHLDHALVGNWKGYRECHITADWLLVYRKDEEYGQLFLTLTRLANHNVLRF